jgi:hypothetical protein
MDGDYLFRYADRLHFLFDEGMKAFFVLPDPGGHLLFHDLPDAIFFLHTEYDPIAPVVTDVHRENAFLQPVRFPEIELSKPAIGFHQLGELNVPDKLNLHKALL